MRPILQLLLCVAVVCCCYYCYGCDAQTNSSAETRLGRRVLAPSARRTTDESSIATHPDTTADLRVRHKSHRLLEGLGCDLSIYRAFIDSDEAQDIFIMATMCESRIVYLKNKRAGAYGPVGQVDLRSAMCSDECLKSDSLHQLALSRSRCTCAQVSATTFVQSDFCLESSARLLCTHLGECGHWGCELEDFMCLRYEWDKLIACGSHALRTSATLMAMIAYEVLDDGELLSAGAFPATLLRDSAATKTSALPPRVELVPLVRANARALLQAELPGSASPRSIEFPIDQDALALVHASAVRTSARRASTGQDTPASLLCRLTAVDAPIATADLDATEASWLSVKLHHASACRARGNDAFKREKLAAAGRAYKKALRWLECPTECAFNATEAAAVHPLALACHTNLATSYAKLNANDKCIAHATRALALEPASVKALFRRSQALVATRAFDDAVRDLERASELEPANKLVRSALERARAAQAQVVAKQRQAFAQLF